MATAPGEPNCPLCLGSGAQCEACFNKRLAEIACVASTPIDDDPGEQEHPASHRQK